MAFNPDPYSFGQEAADHANQAMQQSQAAVDKLDEVLRTQRQQLERENQRSLSTLSQNLQALDPNVSDQGSHSFAQRPTASSSAH